MTSPALSMEALARAVAALPDNGLAAVRRAALEQLQKDGLPGIRDEDWKYTDVSSLIEITNRWLEQGAGPAAPAAAKAPRTIDAHWIRIANGRVDADSLAGLPEGVAVAPLSEMAPGLVPAGRLDSLNLALLHDGLRITVRENAKVRRPIGLHVFDDASRDSISQVRVAVEVLDGGAASFVEYQASGGRADLFANSVISLALARGARASYVRIQHRYWHHNQTSRLAVDLGRDARFQHTSFDIGGRLVRNDLAVNISGAGAEARFGGLYLAGDGQHVDNHTRVDHRVGPAISRQEYRGIAEGKARAVWNGKAIVHGGADGTDAEQSNHNLLLSPNAEIDAKPELEIYTDDVKCSHGTTVGQLDENALYYLRTRGLSRHDARRMLTRAFAQAIINQCPIDALRKYLEDAVDSRLRNLMHEDQS